MRREIMAIIYLLLCLGLIVGCLPGDGGNLNDNLPAISSATPPLEDEIRITPEATAITRPLPAPTYISTISPVFTDTPTPTQISTGELRIFSEPEGALAFIPSENLNAQTPATWALLPGIYTVTVTLAGYQEWMTPITVTVGSQVTLTATLRQEHTITRIEGVGGVWSLAWSEDGQSLIYSRSDAQWPPHVLSLPAYQNWWLYDLTTHTQEALPPRQTRVTNEVREFLGICPFPLPETRPYPYPCSPNLKESVMSNRIVFASMLVGHDVNTWLANVDGTNAIHLETIPEAPGNVFWSSDDQWLLIGVYAGMDHSNVYYLVSVDGTFVESLEELTSTGHWRVQGVKPQFSPDGQKVAFVGIETGGRRLTAQQQDDEEAYNLYVLDLRTLEYELISTRFGLFQWSDDGKGLYVLDGAANTVGDMITYILHEGPKYVDFYYLDLTQEGYPEQRLASDIPVYLPYNGAWGYSSKARAMAGIFGLSEADRGFGILFLN